MDKMSTAKAKAQNDRAKMEANLHAAKDDLVSYCGQGVPNIRRVQNLVKLLQHAWNSLMDSHVTYCAAAGFTMGSEDSKNYISETRVVYMAGVEVAQVLLDKEEKEEEPDKDKLGKDLKRKISFIQVDILEDIKCLTKVLSEATISSEAYREAGEILANLEQKMRVEHKDLVEDLGLYLEAEETEAEKVKANKFKEDHIKKIGELKTQKMMKVPTKDGNQPKPSESSGAGAVKEERFVKRSIKTAPMPIPKWDGKSKSFPRFKLLWKENITPYHEPSALHMMLLQSLPNDVLEEISSLANSHQSIWEHLEEKAGKAEVVAKDIMVELLSLSHRKLGKKFMSKFSVMLEDSEALLISIGMQDWLTSSRSVSDMEDLLPDSEKLEWAKKVKGSSGSERFGKFKAFLKDRKEELEALDSIGSKAGQDRDKELTCTYCGKKGHVEMDGNIVVCRSKKFDQSRGKSKTGGDKKFASDFKNGCAICGNPEHWKNECPEKNTSKNRNFGGRGNTRAPPTHGGQGAVQTDGAVNSNQLRCAECNRCKFASNNISTCIGCKMNGNVDHCLLHCGQYLCLGVEERVKLVRTANACAVCLHSSHQASTCRYKDTASWICGINSCKSHHHPTLHGSKDAYMKINTLSLEVESRFKDVTDWEARDGYVHDSFLASDTMGENISVERSDELKEMKEELGKPALNGDQVLLVIQTVNMVFGPERLLATIVTFFDNGSTCSVILNSVAKQFGLMGEKVVVTIETINAVTTKETMLYIVELLDRDGTRRKIRAFGFDNISEPIGSVELEGIKYMFSTEMQNKWQDWGVRPDGAVQLLVGSEVAHLHPRTEEIIDNLVIKSSIFGTGLVVNGGHPSINCKRMEFDSTVAAIRQGKFARVNRANMMYTQIRDFTPLDFSQKCGMLQEKDFLTAEGLGVEAPKRCRRCSGCADCSFRGRQMSQREAAEYKLMEEGMKFDENLGRFRVDYPFIDDPRKLSNNYRQVVKIAESEERKLAKEGLTEEANKLFNKMIDVGAVSEMSQAELDMWDGPVHYVSIQHVLDPSSATTPLRLVTNSSLADPKTGISLNSILAKGPKVLNDMFEILVRFRVYLKALISDVSKAYYMLLTGELERHVRRVVWRYGESGTDWRIFGFLTVGMGDRPAACLMEISVKMTVLIFGHIDLVAAYRLNRDRFVDDIATGGTEAEVVRFKGVEDKETMVCDGTMPQIMSKTHLFLKAIAVTGEEDGDKLKKLGASVLGLGFSTERDTLMVKFRANTSVKKRGAPTGPDWTVDTIGGLTDVELTFRLCMGVTNCQYDPMGFGCPIVIRLKVAIRDMFRRKLEWDEKLPGDLEKLFKYLIAMVVEAGDLEFRRCAKPEDAVGNCEMIVYWDGSNEAFGVVIYLRWKVASGGYKVYLLTAKSRVTGMWSTSTPRSEMDAAVMATRVAYRVLKSFNLEDMPEVVWIIGDSETVLASREKDAGFFGEFFGNRIGETYDYMEEIQKLTKVGISGEWYHCKSADNAADRASRLDSTPADLQFGSEWQDGPGYLYLERKDWPLERNFADRKSKVLIPEEEILKKYRGVADVCGYIHLNDLVAHTEGVGQLSKLDNTVEDMVYKVDRSAEIAGPGSMENDVLKHFKFGYITNDWEELLRKTAMLFQWRAKVLSKRGQTVSERDMAEMFWMRVAMPATNKAGKEGKLKHLTPKKHDVYDDVVVVTGRALEGLQHYLHRDFLPVLMSSTRTAQLVMFWAHDEDHSGVDITYLTATHVAWIVGGRALAKSVKHSCVRCRFLAKLLEGQQMSVLPARLTVPCPVFSHIGVDLAGPFVVKKEGGSKVTRKNTGTMKIWVILFVCLSTKALKLYVAGGYSTADFLLAWDCYVADHGEPLTCHSDRGSQLVSAAKQNPDLDVPEYDWDLVADSMKTRTAWYFTPAQAQFRNGAVEIFVRKFKRTLEHKFKNRMMRLLEMETALKIVASVTNSRPLSARYGPAGGCDPDFLTPLTPNMMLTGRTNTSVPIRDYDTTSTPLVRLDYVQKVISEWWEQFKVQNFTSLVPTQRWHQEKRNIRVGDVVLVQYTSISSPGTYRLARVVKVEVDEVDGLVHTCTVMYSLIAELGEKERAKYKGVTRKLLRVPVQRLVMILPVEEAEVTDDRVGGSKDEKDNLEAEKVAEEEEFSGKSSVDNLTEFVKESFAWDELGPGLVENGETSFITVRRKANNCKVFELVNLDWYRSDVVANSDPGSSSTDLWKHFKCFGRDACQ